MTPRNLNDIPTVSDPTADSGVFDLAALHAQARAFAESKDPSKSLVVYGVASLHDVNPGARRQARKTRRSQVMPRLGAVLSALVVCTSVAFALHTRASMAPADADPVLGLSVDKRIERAAAPVVDVAPEPVAEPEVATVTEPDAEPPVRRTRPTPRATTRPAVRAPAPAPTPELADRSIEELMRLAAGLPEVPTASSNSLEETPMRTLRPSRERVATAFRSKTTEVRRCGDGGVATARVFLTGSTGRTRSVRVTGVDAAVAACVASALEDVRVDPFLQERLEVTFPYRL